MNPNFRNFALWVIIFLLVVALVLLFQNPSTRAPSQDITFSQLLNEVDQNKVRDVTIAGSEISGHYNDSRGALHLPRHEDPNADEGQQRKSIHQQCHQP